MSHRTLFFMSIVIIIIGVAGIFFQEKESPLPAVTEKNPIRKTRIIAEATRDLTANAMMTASDYRFKEIEINEGDDSAQTFTSLLSTDLNGYLIRHNISKGSTIKAEMIESPLSPTFLQHSLKSNEQPYAVKIHAYDAWLLNFLNTGNNVDLYLRINESSGKGTTYTSEMLAAGSTTAASKKDKTGSSISRFMGPLEIIKISHLKSEAAFSAGSPDEVVGEIILRLSNEQMQKLRVIEKYAEILISRASPDTGNERLSLNDVLPQLTPFHSVRELRGGNQ